MPAAPKVATIASTAHCPKCRNRGHKYEECKLPFLVCFNCGLHNHTKISCPRCNREARETQYDRDQRHRNTGRSYDNARVFSSSKQGERAASQVTREDCREIGSPPRSDRLAIMPADHMTLEQNYKKVSFHQANDVALPDAENMLNKFCSKAEWNDWLTGVSSFHADNAIAPVLVAKYRDSRPHIEILINKEPHVALLDSGASMNCLGNGLHHHFLKQGFKMRPTNIYARVADGAKAVSPGIISLPVTCDGKTKITEFLVTPTLTVNFILGIGFWYAFNLAEELIGKRPPSSVNTVSIVHPDVISNEALKRIRLLQADTIELGKQVNAFGGHKHDKEFEVLEDTLTKQLMKLDSITSNDDINIKRLRKRAVEQVMEIVYKLEKHGEKPAPPPSPPPSITSGEYREYNCGRPAWKRTIVHTTASTDSLEGYSKGNAPASPVPPTKRTLSHLRQTKTYPVNPSDT